jgi:hypothetical protein
MARLAPEPPALSFEAVLSRRPGGRTYRRGRQQAMG